MASWGVRLAWFDCKSIGAQNKDITTAFQPLLTKVKLHLQCRLEKKVLK